MLGFELDFEKRQEVGYRLIDRLNDYYESLPDRPVQLSEEARQSLPDREEAAPFPEVGKDPLAVLEETLVELVDKGFHTPSANYLGLQNPTPTYMSVIAEAIVAATNPQLASLVHAKRAWAMEQEAVRWIGERMGWDGPFDGAFTSGGSEANFTALALALTHHFPSVVEEGLPSINAIPVYYCTSEAHHSIDKAANLVGIGRKALRRIPVTPSIQLDTERLEAEIIKDKANGFTPFCAIATAGTTSSGSIDDIEAIADVCQRHDLWFHVDGAYGASAVLSDNNRHLVQGIERADSVTIDPHKWLATSMSAGMILTSHPNAIRSVFAITNPFMPEAHSRVMDDGFNRGLQWSRRMNSLKLWMTIKAHGRQGYEALIDNQLALASSFAHWIEQSDLFELAAPQMTPCVIFRVRMPTGTPEDEVRAANEALVRDVTQDGQQWISCAVVNGRSVIRTLVISYLTRERHLEALQERLMSARASRDRKVSALAMERVRTRQRKSPVVR